MSKHFATPDAFKQAIEARLRTWGADFPAMAVQTGLSTENLICAFGILSDYWNAHTLK